MVDPLLAAMDVKIPKFGVRVVMDSGRSSSGATKDEPLAITVEPPERAIIDCLGYSL